MTEPVYICTGCGKPILDGEAVHGAMWDHDALTGMHFDCTYAGIASKKGRTAREQMALDIIEMERTAERAKSLLSELRRKIR